MSSKKIPKELKGYTTQEFLGKGSFANVFDCRKNGRKYAMKRINSEERFKKCALKEIEYLKEVDCQYIIKMEEHFIHENIQYLVFECLYDNLYNYVLKSKNYPTFKKFNTYCYQMADGLSYLHNLGIIHCDLKLENVMICNDLKNIKIIDLGSSVRKTKNYKSNFYVQSRYYRAPEILYQINFSEKIDIWSYGVLITEFILRSNIFNGKNTSGMIYKLSDFLDVPRLKIYQESKIFQKLFYHDGQDFKYTSHSFKFKVKGYRDNRLEEYLINGLKVNFNDIYDYQINNIITLVHKILDYNYETRLSAEECKNELILLEYQIDKETEI